MTVLAITMKCYTLSLRFTVAMISPTHLISVLFTSFLIQTSNDLVGSLYIVSHNLSLQVDSTLLRT